MSEKKKLPPGIVGSMDELAAALGVNRRTVFEWRHKHGFPTYGTGQYNIIAVDRWRHGYQFVEDDNPGALLDDMDHSTQALIESLKAMQPELVQSLPESVQDAFSTLLDKTIGDAIKDAYSGSNDYFYTDFYKGEPSQ